MQMNITLLYCMYTVYVIYIYNTIYKDIVNTID